jgi:trans-2,3-dihydro-3-hydroxyanthranilate isomerase
MRGSIDVTLVDACLRAGAGGSPTAVATTGDDLDDRTLTRIPGLAGTSHLAVIGPGLSLRFFTTEGELPSCGHGTVAAVAVLAGRPGGFQGRLRVGGREFAASGVPEPPGDPVAARSHAGPASDAGARSDAGAGSAVGVWFGQGVVAIGPAGPDLVGAFRSAVGLTTEDLHPGYEPAVAAPGRPRLLLPAADRGVLAALRPDHERLAAESRRYGQLGCFVYTPASGSQRAAARMFAPAIGVPEDVANANSTGGLAAHLLATGRDPAVAVDQGDALGRPSTVRATAAPGPHGITTHVGGIARVVGTSRLILT